MCFSSDWELIQNNPITLVRQGGQRESEPEILTAEEFQALREELSAEGLRRVGLTDVQFQEREFTHSRARMMVILAVCLGLSPASLPRCCGLTSIGRMRCSLSSVES